MVLAFVLICNKYQQVKSRWHGSHVLVSMGSVLQPTCEGGNPFILSCFKSNQDCDFGSFRLYFTCFFEGRLRMWGYIISYLTHIYIYIYHRQMRHFVGGSKGVKQPTV